jgi:hypothetical protein
LAQLNDTIILRIIYVNLSKIAIRIAGLTQPLSERSDYGAREFPASIQGCPDCGFTKGENGEIYDPTFPCPGCGRGGVKSN